MTHTPGPWHTIGDGLVYAASSIDDVEAPLVCDAAREALIGPSDEEKANAALIASAPDLLDALRRVLRHIPADMGGASLSDDLRIARAAIARATGA